MDKSGNSHAKDAKDPEPGFPGLDLPEGTESPGGHFLSWQPGRGSYRSPLGLAWTLPAGADVVVQLHLQPIGRPERVAPLIGLYFTDRPPEREFFKLGLTSLAIDIPPGAADHVVEDSFTLPVATSVLGINPHCHYLGKDLRGFAANSSGFCSASSFSSRCRRLVKLFLMRCITGELCTLSRETFRGRSSLSTTPSMKRK